MCFKNLPIEFDQQGNATLLKDVPNPYDYNTTTLDGEQDKLKELLARNGFIKNVDFDPVTRVAGALAFAGTQPGTKPNVKFVKGLGHDVIRRLRTD